MICVRFAITLTEMNTQNHNLFAINNCFKFLFEIYGNNGTADGKPNPAAFLVQPRLFNQYYTQHRVIGLLLRLNFENLHFSIVIYV